MEKSVGGVGASGPMAFNGGMGVIVQQRRGAPVAFDSLEWGNRGLCRFVEENS
jgi:hypothetical protein